MTVLDAGSLAAWAAEAAVVIRTGATADVPCGPCTACCTSSQFVHVEPDETDALAHLPAALLFPAPGLPKGHVLLPYDERGHCPMLVDGRCSVYAHRPRTCRTYDCRVFAATGIAPPEDKPAIVAQVVRWRFRTDAPEDAAAQAALHAAAAAVGVAPDAPRGPTQRAAAAVVAAAS